MSEAPAFGCDLRSLEQIYLKVVEASPDALVVVDAQGYIVVFNAQAELMFGWERSEVVGQPLGVLIPDDRHEVHSQHRARYFREPRIREMGTGQVLEGKHRSGENFRVQIKLSPLIVAGSGVHALAVVRRVQDGPTRDEARPPREPT